MVAPNYLDVFDFSRAEVAARSEETLLKQGLFDLRFSKLLTPETVEEAAIWFRNNRKVVTDLSAAHRDATGTWRQISVRVEGDRDPVILARFAKHWDSALDWTQGRVIGGFDYNTSDPWLSVQFFNISRDQLPSWISSVRGKTYANLVIGEKVDGSQATFSGNWLVLAVEPRWAEDGSASPVVHLGDPDFILTSFRDYLLPTQDDITYIFNVPKEAAQATIESYRREGATVTVQGNESVPGTVDIVVNQTSDQAAVEMTVTVGALCEVDVTQHYRWGLTRVEAEAFASTFSEKEVGKRKSVSVSFLESTGKYNVVATVSEITAQTDLSLSVGAAWDTTEFYEYRWGLTEEEVSSFISDGAYETQENGKSKRVTVTKTDECTFSLVGVISDQGIDQPTLSALVGVTELSTEESEYRFALNDAELLSFLAAYESQEGGTRKDFRPTRRSDGLWNAVGIIIRIGSSAVSSTFGTSHEQEDFEYRFSVTEAEKNDILQSLQNSDTEIGDKAFSLSRNGDDTYTFSIRLRRQKPAHQSFTWSAGAVEHGVEFYFGRTPEDMEGIVNSLARVDVEYNLNLSRNGDGTYNIIIRTSASSGDNVAFRVGSAREFSDFQYHFRINTEELQALVDSVGNDDATVDRDIRIRRDREGLYDLTVGVTDEKRVDYNAVTRVGGNFTEQSFWNFGLNSDAIPTISSEQSVAKQLAVSRNRTGGVQAREDRLTVEEWTSPVFDYSIDEESHFRAQLFQNYAELPTITTTEGRIIASYDQATKTYSGTLVLRQHFTGGASSDQWENYQAHIDTKEMQKVTRGSKVYVQNASVKIHMLQTRDIEDAEAFLERAAPYDAGENVLSWLQTDSQLVTVGARKYRAVWKETNFAGLSTTWTAVPMPV